MTAKKSPGEISRQLQHWREKQLLAGRTPGPRPGRQPWSCPACGGTRRIRSSTGQRRCAQCQPPKQAGRPRRTQ